MVSQDRLKQLLDYDPESGVFKWRERRSRLAHAGSVAGSVSKASRHNGGGYRWIGVDGREYLAHRLAWIYMTGVDSACEVDHKNCDRDDNRFDNLREATDSQNMANRGKPANNTSGYKGVSWNKNARKWVASIMRDGRYKYLGLYLTPEAAHAAYVAEADRSFGEFARAS
jgi:hypothetical protein